jgi:hypothetical protein
MRTAIIVLVFVFLATGCGGASPSVEAPTSPATATKAYGVHFSRPSHVGERAHLVADRSEDMVTRITRGRGRDGAVVSEKHARRSIHYDAVSTTIAVDSRGRPTGVRYDVKELTSDGHPVPASVIQITRHAKEKDAEILVDGSPATDEARKLLSSLFKLGLDGATDDEVLGTKTPQTIGAHWGIDSALAVVSFKEDGLDVASVKGDVWLEGTTRIDGAEYLAVRAKLDIDGVKLSDLPPGSETEESRAQADIQATLPIEEGERERRPPGGAEHESLTTSFRVRVPAPEGAPMMVSVESKESEDTRETAM